MEGAVGILGLAGFGYVDVAFGGKGVVERVSIARLREFKEAVPVEIRAFIDLLVQNMADCFIGTVVPAVVDIGGNELMACCTILVSDHRVFGVKGVLGFHRSAIVSIYGLGMLDNSLIDDMISGASE